MNQMPANWHQEVIRLLPKIRRFAFSLTGSVDDADDLLQATVERALARWQQFQKGTSVEKWMFRICKNLWIDEWRARKVRGPVIDIADSPFEPSVDGTEVAIRKLQLREVSEAMQHLSDEQRMALSLVAVEGLSYREAGAVMEVPTGTVMSRLARARRALVERLAERPASERDVL